MKRATVRVKELTIGGVSQRFGSPATPEPSAPATDAAALDDLVETHPENFPDASDDLSVGGAVGGTGLSDLDPTAPFSAELSWSEEADDSTQIVAVSVAELPTGDGGNAAKLPDAGIEAVLPLVSAAALLLMLGGALLFVRSSRVGARR